MIQKWHIIKFHGVLGALTKGDRRAASGADLTEFNFDTPYGRAALRSMYSCICQNEIVPGLSFSTVSKGAYEDFASFNAVLMVCSSVEMQ